MRFVIPAIFSEAETAALSVSSGLPGTPAARRSCTGPASMCGLPLDRRTAAGASLDGPLVGASVALLLAVAIVFDFLRLLVVNARDV